MIPSQAETLAALGSACSRAVRRAGGKESCGAKSDSGELKSIRFLNAVKWLFSEAIVHNQCFTSLFKFVAKIIPFCNTGELSHYHKANTYENKYVCFCVLMCAVFYCLLCFPCFTGFYHILLCF